MRRIGVLVGVLLLGYLWWCRAGRRAPAAEEPAAASEPLNLGTDEGAGNLLAVQPAVTPADYASETRFYARLDGCLAAARAYLTPRTVVVFPEYLGAWLVTLGEKEAVYRAPTLAGALRTLVLSNLPAFLWQWARTPGARRVRGALFRLKARAMAAAYQRTFATLARRYGVTIVAGSIVLPAPRVVDGVLTCGDGPLYNTAAVYAPDGRAHAALTRKVHLTPDEQGWLTPGTGDTQPVYQTPLGRLGVLLCADAWYPDAYARLRALGVAAVAVSSYAVGDGKWARPWGGYTCAAGTPSDVDPSDVRRLTEGDAWRHYALAGRFAASGARAGVNAFLRGRLWNLGADGCALLCRHADRGHAADILLANVWLPPPGQESDDPPVVE